MSKKSSKNVLFRLRYVNSAIVSMTHGIFTTAFFFLKTELSNQLMNSDFLLGSPFYIRVAGLSTAANSITTSMSFYNQLMNSDF